MGVVRGYDFIDDASPCPYCGCKYFCIEDDGNNESYLVICWCGARCRCRKNDAGIVAHLARTQGPSAKAAAANQARTSVTRAMKNVRRVRDGGACPGG